MRAAFRITEDPTDYAPSERLNDLLVKALHSGMAQEEKGDEVVPMLIVDRAGKYDLTAFVDVDYEAARRMAAQKVAESADCDAYVLFAAATLTGTSFRGIIKAFVAEGAERGMGYGYRLFGVPDEGRIVPIYDGHTEQFLR
jgi:hypothetical protein